MKRYFKTVFLILMIFFVSVNAVGISAAEEAVKPTKSLSHGMNVIKNKLKLTKTALKGEEISFTAEDFYSAVGREEVKIITLSSLPDEASGRLKFGVMNCFKGQSIPISFIRLLRFVPKNRLSDKAEFSFTVDGDESVICTVYSLDKENSSPVAKGYEYTAVKNTPLSAIVNASDPDGDGLELTVVKEPQHGTVRTELSEGFVYEPDEDFTGKDSFVYTVSDEYGGTSEEAVCIIRVEDGFISSASEEMSYAIGKFLLDKADIGIGTAKNVSDGAEVRRIDFLVAAMKALGVLPHAISYRESGFSDVNELTAAEKGYIISAESLGILDSAQGDFRPYDSITESEAREISGKMCSSLNAEADLKLSWELLEALGGVKDSYEIILGGGKDEPLSYGAAAVIISYLI